MIAILGGIFYIAVGGKLLSSISGFPSGYSILAPAKGFASMSIITGVVFLAEGVFSVISLRK